MKGAVLRGVRDVRVEEIPEPVIEPGSIIVDVKACGICGSDLHPYKLGHRQGIVCGHEFSGQVRVVGQGVEGVKEGDRVVAVGYRPCGQCYWCKQGLVQRCTSLQLLGEQFHGAMAPRVLVPNAVLNRNVFRLPDNLSYEQGALVEPISVAAFSVRRAKVAPQNAAAVIGLGIIGLGVVQVLKAFGVSKVIASGRRESRLRAAGESGADLVIDAASADAVQAVKDATGGFGVETVFECAGSPETFHQAADMARGGGKVILVGVYEQPVTWDPNLAIIRNLTFVGILGGHFPTSIDLLASGKINTKPLITHAFPVEKAKEAFETQMTDPTAVKVLITP